MIDREPSLKDMIALWQHCVAFIETQDIYSRETVYQSDRVIENGYVFIADVCEIVGYVELEDEEDD
jgi:hypothetical protein